MKIELLEPRGFCAGVRSAVRLAEDLAARSGEVWCLHEIVHNPIVVGGLADRGFRFVRSLAEVPDGADVLFSAHGVAPSVAAEAASRGMRVFDATCPFVKRVHAAAAAFHARGMAVAIVGHAGHAEVEGIAGEAPGASVVSCEEDAEALSVPGGRLGVVFQTTFDAELAGRIADILSRRFGAEISPGVCGASRERQEAVRAFSGDAVLVLGGSASSNTRRLREAARCRSFLAGTMDELRAIDFSGVARLGVTAGASTPESFVAEAVEHLRTRWR